MTGFFTAMLYRYIIYVRLIAAVLLLIIGILMFFDYNLSFKSISAKSGGGVLNSFALGFFTSIAWADCYSAYLISLITLLVSSNSPLYAVRNIIIYVLGFALTLLVLCLAISKIDLEIENRKLEGEADEILEKENNKRKINEELSGVINQSNEEDLNVLEELKQIEAEIKD